MTKKPNNPHPPPAPIWHFPQNLSFIRPTSTRGIPYFTIAVILLRPLGSLDLKVAVVMCRGAGNP